MAASTVHERQMAGDGSKTKFRLALTAGTLLLLSGIIMVLIASDPQTSKLGYERVTSLRIVGSVFMIVGGILCMWFGANSVGQKMTSKICQTSEVLMMPPSRIPPAAFDAERRQQENPKHTRGEIPLAHEQSINITDENDSPVENHVTMTTGRLTPPPSYEEAIGIPPDSAPQTALTWTMNE